MMITQLRMSDQCVPEKAGVEQVVAEYKQKKWESARQTRIERPF